MKTKVMLVIGTRPEAIKMAPVILELRTQCKLFDTFVVTSGQHGHMVSEALSVFGIVPDMMLPELHGLSLAQAASTMLERLGQLVASRKPDWVLAQGDTTTVLAASMAAFFCSVKFGHIEAGLRTGDLESPFPEEGIRVAVDAVSSCMYAPTDRAVQNLRNEARDMSRVLMTGNTVVDAVLYAASIPFEFNDDLQFISKTKGPIVLVTTHRRENIGSPLERICDAVSQVGRLVDRRDGCVVLPVHPNPSVRQTVTKLLGAAGGVSLVPPLSYIECINVVKSSAIVLTDSGGLQEEAPTFSVPVGVLRETTERPEAVDSGIAELLGTDPERILSFVDRHIGRGGGERRHARNPFGDGRAAQRIVQSLR